MLILDCVKDFKNEEIEIIGTPRECGSVLVKVDGVNNRLLLGKNVQFGHVKFDFRGDNNTVVIEGNVLFRGNILIHSGSTVRIGAGTKFHFNAILEARETTSIDIGKDCLLSQVRIVTCDVHTIFDLETGKRVNKSHDIKLHDHVWLAFEAMICKGSEIGKDSVVGARALVAGKFPSNCVIAGNPAKVIRHNVTWDYRSLETIPKDCKS